MLELLKNTFKLFFRRRSLLFWTFLFPIILSTLFFVAIKPAYEGGLMKTIDIALVSNDESVDVKLFSDLLDSLEYDDGTQMLEVNKLSHDEALIQLEDGEIEGIYIVENTVSLEIKKEGLSTIMLEMIATTYNQQQELFIKAASTKGIDFAIATFEKEFSVENEEIKIQNNNQMSLQYYTIFGMSCFYCAYWGLQTSYDSEANLSEVAARKMVVPTSKFKLLLSDYIVSFIVSFLSQTIVFAYMYFVLGMEVSDYSGWMLLLIATGCLAGISWGKIIATALKSSEKFKNGIVTILPLIGSMFGGMMGTEIRRFGLVKVVNVFNPMNWINEGMYSLYVYGISDEFMRNLVSLLLFASLGFILSILLGRKKQYESL